MAVGINSFLHEQPRAGAANVALVKINSVDDAFNGLVKRRVFEHNIRRLAAEFERESFFVPATSQRDCLPISVEPVNAILFTSG